MLMNEETPQPQQNTNPQDQVAAGAPPNLPTQPNPVPTNEPPHSHKKVVVLIIVLLVLLVGAAAAALYVVTSKEDKSAEQTSQTQPSNTNTTTTTELSTVAATVAVTHPSSWNVNNEEETYDGSPEVYKKITIQSPKGTYLRLSSPNPVGGDCAPDNYSYTMTQKIPTATPNIFFVEYSTTNPNFPLRHLWLQDFTKNQPGNTTKNVGDTAKDLCTLAGYPIMHTTNEDFYEGVYVNIQASDGEQLSYAEVSGDTEFVDMLKTLKVTFPNQ